MKSTKTSSTNPLRDSSGEISKKTERDAKSGGNQGYAGYEYQKIVTVWFSLELMIAKELAETITVEPRSQEDIEAALHTPDDASLNVSSAPYKLTVQVKSRSNAPWTSAAFAKVLRGDTKKNKAAQRVRPIDMLIANPHERYVLVTNEGVDASLRPHTAESLFDFPAARELPPHARRGVDAVTQASLAPRIAICGGLTIEILDNRIRRILEIHGHVPAGRHSGCVQELRDAIGQRMLGEQGGHFSKAALVQILVKHEGSVLPTRRMDHYVPPQSYGRIKQSLDERHAVIIAGPSGTGKTLTADILELAYRRFHSPYEIVGGENGPGPVRSRLANPLPVLFHLRDPWGSNRVTPEAEPWSNELPKLLTQANASHKFLITSRSDVLRSAGTELDKKLAPYIVQIEIEDYGDDLLAAIYDGLRSDLSGYAAELAQRYRSAALKTLTRPYEIDRFLAALPEQTPLKPQKPDRILKASQIEAISSVVADQVMSQGDRLAAATILWALLQAREALTTDVLHKINRLVRAVDRGLRPDLEGLVDFLVAGRNLRREGEILTFYHPRVEDGLRMAIARQRNEAEYVLSCLVNGLAMADEERQDWGIETGLRVLESVDPLKWHPLSLFRETHKKLDEFLENRLLSVDQVPRAEKAFSYLAKYGSNSHIPSIIARLLLKVNEIDREDEHGGFAKFWDAPQVDASTLQDIRRYPNTSAVLSIFIREVLPFSHLWYRESLAPLLYSFANGLNKDFRSAVETVAEPRGPAENIDAIVHGACSGDEADFEWVIQQFLRCQQRADVWWTEFQPTHRKAEEHVFDAAYADHVFEEPQEYFYNSNEGLKTVVALRAQREGVSWLKSHKDRELLAYRLAEFLRESEEKVPIETLRTLLECTNARSVSVWRAVEKHWDENLKDVLHDDLVMDNLDEADLREILLRVAALSPGGVDKVLPELLSQMSSFRRLEVLRDLMQVTLEGDARGELGQAIRQSRAEGVATLLPELENELGLAMIKVLAEEDPRKVVAGLSRDALQELQAKLPGAPLSVAGVLAFLGAAARLDIRAATNKLLQSDSIMDGIAAALSLSLQPSVEQLLNALKHPRYQVRCRALKVLSGLSKKEDRSVLLKSADDPSADVRLTWAKLMADLHWPEAIESLVKLLNDKRNFSSDYGMMNGPVWAEFLVARAAAHALKAYSEIPQAALDDLITAATTPNDDLFVPCACLSAISTKDDLRITGILLDALAAKGLKGARRFRPLAQAAAWALFDRAVAGKLDAENLDLTAAILDPRPSIAAPALLAAACVNVQNNQAILAKLEAQNLSYRIELFRVAITIVRETPPEGGTERERYLASLASGTTLQELGEQGKILESWSRSLRVEEDVQGYTSWLVKTTVGLPVTETVEEPRKFDLPERIGILTLRSMTPAREAFGRSPDDGL